MKYLFVCYPKCSTCRKARKLLDDSAIEYELRDIKTSRPTYEELEEWWVKSGLPLNKLFNSSGVVYINMQLKYELPKMTDEEKLRLLATDGLLVKRPILIGDDKILFGFKEEQWQGL